MCFIAKRSCNNRSIAPPGLTSRPRTALGEHRVVDLTKDLGLAQSTFSKHLACLLDSGIVQVRPQGRASVYSLAYPQATLELLAAAEELLGPTGDAVALCPRYGEGTTP